MLLSCCCGCLGRCCVLLHRASDSWSEVARVPFPPACAAAWPSHTAPHACASAQLPQRLHSGWHAWNAAARASSSRFSRGMARTYLLILPRSYNINSFCDCAQLRTGSHRNNFRLRTRLRTPISSVAKYSLRVSIAPKKIIKAQWSSVGTVRTDMFA